MVIFCAAITRFSADLTTDRLPLVICCLRSTLSFIHSRHALVYLDDVFCIILTLLLRFEVETVNGKEVLRFAVFSGVDTLGGMANLANADMGKLMPSFSAKFTSGFGMGDLLTSGAKLKDMATWKFEVTLSYVKNLIILVSEVFQLSGTLSLQIDCACSV